jgi:hypothetical protein
MSPPSKMEVSHDPREVELKQRRPARFNRKCSGSHSRKFSACKILKSSSSPERPKFDTLYSPNIGSPAVIKEHEDSNII